MLAFGSVLDELPTSTVLSAPPELGVQTLDGLGLHPTKPVGGQWSGERGSSLSTL
jgi:hypothetical protein